MQLCAACMLVSSSEVYTAARMLLQINSETAYTFTVLDGGYVHHGSAVGYILSPRYMVVF